MVTPSEKKMFKKHTKASSNGLQPDSDGLHSSFLLLVAIRLFNVCSGAFEPCESVRRKTAGSRANNIYKLSALAAKCKRNSKPVLEVMAIAIPWCQDIPRQQPRSGFARVLAAHSRV